MHCHICGFDKTESDAASGTTFCVNCGTVLEENTIVSEITFGETAGGKAVLQGSRAGESGRISGGGLFGKNRREGQEQALENGRQKIASLAHATRLPERYRESAQRYYNLAVVNRFTRGRKTEHVAAVCLYAVCRNEKSSHMLIDFSDVLQINVFTLGSTFLKLCRVLNLTLPHVDPSLYISRFAVALDFGDYTQRVAQDAVRIAQRMDRDWIVSGRRPAGICGACLLIAARMNGFRRTVSEMIYIVKVADVTIQKRLKEFNETESAQLSVRDFRTIWLDKRSDPPSYTKNRKQQQAEQTRAAMKRATDGEGVALPRKKLARRRNNNIRKSTIGDNITIDESSTRTPKIHIKSDLAASSSSKRKAIQDEDSKQDHDEEMVEVEVIEDRMDAIINKEVRKITEEKQKNSNDEDEQTEAENTQVEEDDETTQVEKNKPIPRVLANDSADSESDYESEDGYGAQDQEQEDDEEDEEDDLDGPTQVEHRNVAGYKSLPEDVQKELEYIARKKVELEEKALLNPDLNEDALKISEEMEKWMEDDSILKAAESLENEKYGRRRSIRDSVSDDEDTENTNADQSQRRVIRDDDNFSDVDDEEVEAMILTPEEVRLKTKVWYNANKTYLEEMAIKRMVEKDKGINPLSRKGKNKRKHVQPASTPAEAAKQLVAAKKISKKINHAVFDDMFESPESIAKIKAADEMRKAQSDGSGALPIFEVVEESGNVPTAAPNKSKEKGQETQEADDEEEEDDDEEMDLDDMADDERLMREGRARYYGSDNDEPYDYDDDDY